MTRAQQDNDIEQCESELIERDSTVINHLRRPLTPWLTVDRAIPQRTLRMVGPWCFVDHFGPVAAADYQAFDVAPHPHIGLQTITWLFSGQLLHLDSLGNEQPLRAGELNVMTAGKGISHAEVADVQNQAPLHGLQLWSALPLKQEQCEPTFEHHRQCPLFSINGAMATLLVGHYENYRSPASCYHPQIAMTLTSQQPQTSKLHLKPEFEYALVVCQGRIYVDGKAVNAQQTVALGSSRSSVHIEFSTDTRALLIGGEPFPQPVTMWWNFVSQKVERLAQAAKDWQQHQPRFGNVRGYQGKRIEGPEFPNNLKQQGD